MSANKSSTTRFRLEPNNRGSLSPEQAAKLDAAKIDYSDIPELRNAFWSAAGRGISESKTQVTLRIDTDILNFFRGTGKRYQTRINAILRAYMQTQETTRAEFASRAESQSGKDDSTVSRAPISGDTQHMPQRNAELQNQAREKIEEYLRQMKAIRETTTSGEFVMILDAQRKLQAVGDAELQALIDGEQKALMKTTAASAETAVAVMKAAISAANTSYETVHKARKQAVDMAEQSFNASTTAASRTIKQGPSHASRARKK